MMHALDKFIFVPALEMIQLVDNYSADLPKGFRGLWTDPQGRVWSTRGGRGRGRGISHAEVSLERVRSVRTGATHHHREKRYVLTGEKAQALIGYPVIALPPTTFDVLAARKWWDRHEFEFIRHQGETFITTDHVVRDWSAADGRDGLVLLARVVPEHSWTGHVWESPIEKWFAERWRATGKELVDWRHPLWSRGLRVTANVDFGAPAVPRDVTSPALRHQGQTWVYDGLNYVWARRGGRYLDFGFDPVAGLVENYGTEMNFEPTKAQWAAFHADFAAHKQRIAEERKQRQTESSAVSDRRAIPIRFDTSPWVYH